MKENTQNGNNYWKNNDICDVLNEVIEPDDVDVSSIQLHKTLNPKIWKTENKINESVRKKLLLNAKRFIEFCNVEKLKFNDIILTGSLANYNYNENSDLDVHIILDFDQISDNKDFVADFFKTKKELWSEQLPIQIMGYDVEMYFQNSSEPHHSSGTYSLIKDRWIKKPINKIININTTDIQLKVSDLMNAIDELETNKNKKDFLKRYEKLKNKIKKYRQSGLYKTGEYSIENLVFKVLRNTGYLKKLIMLKNNYLANELSLNEK